MKQNPTYFIEQIAYTDGHILSVNPLKIQYLKWSIDATKNHPEIMRTIAVFKIYPKNASKEN